MTGDRRSVKSKSHEKKRNGQFVLASHRSVLIRSVNNQNLGLWPVEGPHGEYHLSLNKEENIYMGDRMAWTSDDQGNRAGGRKKETI